MRNLSSIFNFIITQILLFIAIVETYSNIPVIRFLDRIGAKLLQYLSDELQKKIASENPQILNQIPYELRKEILLENPSLLEDPARLKILALLDARFLSDIFTDMPRNIQELIVLESPSQMHHLEGSMQAAMILIHPKMIQHLTIEQQKIIILGYLAEIDKNITSHDEDSATLLNDPIGDAVGVLLGYVSDGLKSDKELMLNVVKRCLLSLDFASPNLRDDREVVLAAISRDSFAVYEASSRLKDDKIVMLAAVKKNGFTISYASDDIKKDQDVVLAALIENISIIDPRKTVKINITVKATTSKQLISAVRANPQILNSMSGDFFTGINNIAITPAQALLRESILAKIFFRKYGLYIQARVFLGGMKGRLHDVCLNRMLGFMLPKYDSERMNALCLSKNPAIAAGLADRLPLMAEAGALAADGRAAVLPSTHP